MLTQMMSAGAMGGGVSSAISRALGAGDRERAATLALHAVDDRPARRAGLHAVMWLFGRTFLCCSAAAAPCSRKPAPTHVLFAGAISIWLVNTLASIVRGTGDMKVPSATLLVVAVLQVILGGTLGLGLAGARRNSACAVSRPGKSSPYTLGTIFLIWYLISGRSRLDSACVARLRFSAACSSTS